MDTRKNAIVTPIQRRSCIFASHNQVECSSSCTVDDWPGIAHKFHQEPGHESNPKHRRHKDDDQRWIQNQFANQVMHVGPQADLRFLRVSEALRPAGESGIFA